MLSLMLFSMSPFSSSPFQNFHCSPLNAVPKKDGSTRIILDLSSPSGSLVNEGIPSEFFSIKYSFFNDAVSMVREVGRVVLWLRLTLNMHFALSRFIPMIGHCWVTSG